LTWQEYKVNLLQTVLLRGWCGMEGSKQNTLV